jgi:hypothetical protein
MLLPFFQCLLFSFLFSTNIFVASNYAGRKWTYQGRMIQSVNVYSRSPFVMYGRGYQLVLSGYDRDSPTMYVDFRYEYEGIQQAWSVHATMRPPDSLPAVVDYNSPGREVLYEGSKYGHWIAAGGTFETKTFFAVSASYDPMIFNASLRYNDSGSVYIYHGEYSHWTNTQKLRLEPLYPGSFFGTCVSICPKHPHVMSIGAEGDQSGSGVFKAGSAFVYRSTPDTTKWSVSQKLVPDHFEAYDRFGYVTKIYDDFLLVSSQGDDDHGLNTGAVYIFREERALGLNKWSVQQKLYSHVKSTDFGEFSELYGHTLVVGSYQEDEYGGGTNTGAVYVYKTFPTLEPPYIPPPPTRYRYDDHRVLTDGENDDEDGALVPSPKPKPPPPRVMFKWWSFQQKLTARDWHVFRGFGKYSALGGDGRLIATGAFGESYNDTTWGWTAPFSPHSQTGSAYIFVKHQTEHKWTQQQKFLGPRFPKALEYYSDPYLHGSDLIIRDTEAGHVYTDKLEWNCLQVYVSDHFGDGWDTAYLKAYAPGSFTKVTDHYTPFCSSPNPLKFRYCPLLDEDIGEYLFKLSDDVFTKKFWPEIRWSIKNEKDNRWYYGDARTSIKFMWIQETRQFDHVLNPADKLIRNDVCVACSPDLRPKPKPKAGGGGGHDDDIHRRHRVLKGGDDTKIKPTRSPTISPAPTVSYDETTEDWALMLMSTSDPEGWWGFSDQKNGTGTSYFIYDATGKVLIYTGTICGTQLLTGACRIELEDGDYILRVGGAIDLNSAGHSWTFCGRTGNAQEMLTFNVKYGQCTPYTQVTAGEYCWSNYNLAIVAAGMIQLQGVSGMALVDEDLEVIGEAIKTVTSVHVSKVKLELEEHFGASPNIKFLAYIDPLPGYSALNSMDSFTLYDLFYNEIEAMSVSGKLTSNIVVLSQMIRTESSSLINLQSASIVSILNAGPSFNDLVSTTYEPINFLHKDETQDSSTTSANEPTPTQWQKFLENIFLIDSELGFIALAAVLFVALGVSWRLSIRQSIRTREPYTPLIPPVDEAIEPLLNTSNSSPPSPLTPSLSPPYPPPLSPSLPSDQTSRQARSQEVMSALMEMKDDLKKLADIEDESLPRQVDDSLNLLSKSAVGSATSASKKSNSGSGSGGGLV